MTLKIQWHAFFLLGAGAQILDDGWFEPSTGSDQALDVPVQVAGEKLSPPLKLLAPAFDSVVKAENGPDEFVVFFCVSWLEQCQDLLAEFRRRGSVLEGKLNEQQIFAPKVRFAEVDCAEDKVLCNREGVETYPTITRYLHGGSKRHVWTGSLGQKHSVAEKAMLGWMNANIGVNVDAPVPEELSSADPLRWAARFGSFIAVIITLVKTGLDVLQSTLEAARVSAGGASAEEEAKQAALRARREQAAVARQAADAAADAPSCRMTRRLPQAWAMQRSQLDL